jgi:hypothetical protein
MSQIDSWYYPKGKKPYTIVGCPRKDCDAKAKAFDIDGPWEILPECAYLLDEELDFSRIPVANRNIGKKRFPRVSKRRLLAKIGGCCYSCGEMLNSTNYKVDHITPQVSGGENDIENLVLCCKSYNSAKSTKSLDDFRFHRAMQLFHKETGVSFPQLQMEYLETIGISLEIPGFKFGSKRDKQPNIWSVRRMGKRLKTQFLRQPCWRPALA